MTENEVVEDETKSKCDGATAWIITSITVRCPLRLTDLLRNTDDRARRKLHGKTCKKSEMISPPLWLLPAWLFSGVLCRCQGPAFGFPAAASLSAEGRNAPNQISQVCKPNSVIPFSWHEKKGTGSRHRVILR